MKLYGSRRAGLSNEALFPAAPAAAPASAADLLFPKRGHPRPMVIVDEPEDEVEDKDEFARLCARSLLLPLLFLACGFPAEDREGLSFAALLNERIACVSLTSRRGLP